MSKHLPAQDLLNTTSSQDGRAMRIGDFRSYLVARGYAAGTLQHYCSAAGHFVDWLDEPDGARPSIDAQNVSRFLHEHLPACRCPHPGCKDLKSARAALNQLLRMQDEDRLRPPAELASHAIEAVVTRFDVYLKQVCGLAPATRWYQRRYVRTFLRGLYGDAPVDFSRITAEALLRFVNEQARHLRPASVGVLAYALRTFLRFLPLEGTTRPELIRAVPRPAVWSLATLPPSLSAVELRRFWKALERSDPVGRRDYAMARCLADLGLRCQEVANLQLEDIDWRNATVRLTGNKSRRAGQLPLPQITGNTLADYLRHGRPATTSRSVFVLHRAPVGQAITGAGVRGAIRRAFARAGMTWSGTHVLRHTAAARMVQGGASLKEVADVLGHRSIDTTLIYPKVEVPQLARVALPWPGRCP